MKRTPIIQVIYALQERGNVQFETVALTMEPQGYHKDILIVHMRNFTSAYPDVAASHVSLPTTPPLPLPCAHLLPPPPPAFPHTHLLHHRDHPPATLHLLTECVTREQVDENLQKQMAAGGEDDTGGRAARGEHPDMFDESMVDEFAGLFEDSD